MYYLPSFIVCVAMSLVNLPFYLEDGNAASLCSMIFCGALACAVLVLMAVDEAS